MARTFSRKRRRLFSCARRSRVAPKIRVNAKPQVPDRHGRLTLLLASLTASFSFRTTIPAYTRMTRSPALSTSHVDHAVVGIADEAQPPLFELLVELVEHDVGQQRRQRAALWRSFAGFLDQVSDQNPAGEKGRISRSTRLSAIACASRLISRS